MASRRHGRCTGDVSKALTIRFAADPDVLGFETGWGRPSGWRSWWSGSLVRGGRSQGTDRALSAVADEGAGQKPLRSRASPRPMESAWDWARFKASAEYSCEEAPARRRRRWSEAQAKTSATETKSNTKSHGFMTTTSARPSMR